MKKIVAFLLVVLTSIVVTQAYSDDSQHNVQTTQVIVQGCVSQSSTRDVLMEYSGNSYVLESVGIFHPGDYLGQQVEVTGSESPTFSTSSTYAMSGAGIPSVTIKVHSIKTISAQCTY